MEQVGLPDIVWLYAEGGTIKIENQIFTMRPFYIAKYPITHKQFQSFMNAKDGYKNNRWWRGVSAKKNFEINLNKQYLELGNHPCNDVSWYDAIAYCQWLNVRLDWSEFPTNLSLKKLDMCSSIRLPTEWEWQWAASGGHRDYVYPWGKKWDRRKSNSAESGLFKTVAVGLYPSGISKFGALDMSGNIWEWCLNENEKLVNVGLRGDAIRTLRGGSWHSHRDGLLISYRSDDFPHSRINSGFRLVVRPQGL
jgi:formylglycine-generating enzyme required for sulfatase activity